MLKMGRTFAGSCLLSCVLMALPAAAQPVAPAPAVPSIAPEKPYGLGELIRLALDNNVKTRVAREKIREAEAHIAEATSAYLPTFRFVTQQANRTINLAQQGLSGTGLPIPIVVGPFWSFDSRVTMVYNILDAGARWKTRSARLTKLVNETEEQFAEQTVETLTSISYVNLISSRNSLTVSQADLLLAQKYLKLAQDQKDAGTAAGIDVTRAAEKVSENRLKVNRALDMVARSSLDLTRLAGLPLDLQIIPTDPLLPPVEGFTTVEKARDHGLMHRLDLVAARRREDQLKVEISVALATNSPSLQFSGDYGIAGNTPTMNAYGTYDVGLTLSIPIFDGGLSVAKADVARSQLRQASINRQDTEVQVDQDVRDSYLKLTLAQHQLNEAAVSRELADKELKMASDRFRAGLTTSLEVASAFDSLTTAHDAELQAQVQFNLALVQMAASMGSPESIFEFYHIPPLVPTEVPKP